MVRVHRVIIGAILRCTPSTLHWCTRPASRFSERLRQHGHWPQSGDRIRCSPNPLRTLWGGPTAQAIGLFSKESAVVLPGIMLVYGLTWFDRTTWRRLAPAYAALALPFAAFFYLRAQAHLH